MTHEAKRVTWKRRKHRRESGLALQDFSHDEFLFLKMYNFSSNKSVLPSFHWGCSLCFYKGAERHMDFLLGALFSLLRRRMWAQPQEQFRLLTAPGRLGVEGLQAQPGASAQGHLPPSTPPPSTPPPSTPPPPPAPHEPEWVRLNCTQQGRELLQRPLKVLGSISSPDSIFNFKVSSVD